jgi:hypothetical protein
MLATASPLHAQVLGALPGGDFGTLSVGAGFYNAPDTSGDESGFYTLARLMISQFELELDYGLSDSDFLLGSANYLYYVPTAEQFTQTAVALGAGYTFILEEGKFDYGNGGFNVLGQVQIADTISAQIRYDFLGGESDILTFGLSYSLF